MANHTSTVAALQYFDHSQVSVATPSLDREMINPPTLQNPWQYSESASQSFGGLVYTNSYSKRSNQGISTDTIVVVESCSTRPFGLDEIKQAALMESESEIYQSSKVAVGDTFTLLDSHYHYMGITHHCLTKYQPINGGEALRQISTTVVSEEEIPDELRRWTTNFNEGR